MANFWNRIFAWDQRRLMASMDRGERRQREIERINHPNWPDPKFAIVPLDVFRSHLRDPEAFDRAMATPPDPSPQPGEMPRDKGT